MSNTSEIIQADNAAARRRFMILALLLLAYTFNFIDRTIISVLGEAIKRDLKITDTQLGLLGGIFFSLLYTCLGLPIARLAERVSRVNVIAVSIAIWSGFTALCGVAASFASLGFFRFGVGIGEAGLTPPGHSLIADYYPPQRRATALAIYSLGVPIGTMIGALAGGWITQHISWRAAFLFVGLPGLAVAILFKLFVREPARGASEPRPAGVSAAPLVSIKQPFSLRGELHEIVAVSREALQHSSVRWMLCGTLVTSTASAAGNIFLPTFLIRSFGYNYATVGLCFALIAGVGAAIGGLSGAVLADRLAQRRPEWLAIVPGIGALFAAAFSMAAFNSPTGITAVALLMAGGVAGSSYVSISFSLLYQNVSPVRRATAAAVYLFIANLIAVGLGPFITGLLIDHLAAHGYASALAADLHVAGSVAADTFRTACPGGVAPKGSSAEMVRRCADVLNHSTREALTITYAAMIGSGLFYLTCARAIRRESASRQA